MVKCILKLGGHKPHEGQVQSLSLIFGHSPFLIPSLPLNSPFHTEEVGLFNVHVTDCGLLVQSVDFKPLLKAYLTCFCTLELSHFFELSVEIH